MLTEALRIPRQGILDIDDDVRDKISLQSRCQALGIATMNNLDYLR